VKKLVLGLLLGVAVGVSATAYASGSAKTYYLKTGDDAVDWGGDTLCTDVRRNGTDSFACKVGGDYRAKYGVLINDRQAAITRYMGLDQYVVVVRKLQPAAPG